MPNNPRQATKRKLEQAEGNMDTAMGYMKDIAGQFEGNHQEITDALVGLMELQLIVQTEVGKIRKLI